ncbi:MAG: cob(I)alamin adenosyltransferase [bacterium]|nr:MAG: cob(I)alamin adenosyltransferase [bacterium]
MSGEVRGLTVIFTGNGKGKTSAALGVVLRALGHGFRCKVIQFIKGEMDSGELHLAGKFGGEFEIAQSGRGFTWLKDHTVEEHKAAAQDGLRMASTDMLSENYRVLVLDEILYALTKELVTLKQLYELIGKKPPSTHLILTGRAAPSELIEKADMVTSMESIKHPFKSGIPAQKGLDF